MNELRQVEESWKDYIKKQYWKNHDELKKCTICGLEIKNYKLISHRRTFHRELFHCEICDKNIKDIWKHKKLIHFQVELHVELRE